MAEDPRELSVHVGENDAELTRHLKKENNERLFQFMDNLRISGFSSWTTGERKEVSTLGIVHTWLRLECFLDILRMPTAPRMHGRRVSSGVKR